MVNLAGTLSDSSEGRGEGEVKLRKDVFQPIRPLGAFLSFGLPCSRGVAFEAAGEAGIYELAPGGAMPQPADGPAGLCVGSADKGSLCPAHGCLAAP